MSGRELVDHMRGRADNPGPYVDPRPLSDKQRWQVLSGAAWRGDGARHVTLVVYRDEEGLLRGRCAENDVTGVGATLDAVIDDVAAALLDWLAEHDEPARRLVVTLVGHEVIRVEVP